ncbi:hybrid sensor histidine kinase/response regulator [Ramlibacter tataouinensis]|uniref:histidine kinase n=1 Tax=Ramlibacter tataouinensis (strain ATCC BAA-407 / DSM 14655 / LMG 21543 / TTB310) TaxID=365046 RepID=F5XZ99_RAMTT|nr:PAS domain S-box protein [Ramlibacter tataouinensis]AEG93269.1 candidate histidine kinase, hybrid [Ramlibacter tataouinensis TTB310]
MPNQYLATSLPEHELAELHRLMTEEIKEVAVFFMNTEGIITTWNRAAEDMKGYTPQDAIGSHLGLLYTEEDRARGWPEHNLGEARKHGFYREESWRRRKDGRLFWARIALTALRDRTGQLVGFSKVTMDLTDHKLLESCVNEREEIRRILHAANAGMWTWHPASDRIDVSADFLGLLGHAHGPTTMSLPEWMAFVDPQDRELVARRFETARASGADEPLVMDVRLCKKDGSCRWFHVRADWSRASPQQPYALSGVNVDIHDLKTAEEELRRAFGKLKEADKRKDEFLAMLAHELRNPLAPIRSAAELLKRIDVAEPRVRKTSEIIARQVDHMTHLVDDLLDVSRVTRGVATLDKEPLDVRHIVMDAVEQVDPLLRTRRHELALQLSPETAVVYGDHKRLVQVMANLLNNAAKYTPEGGRIQLRTQVRGAQEVVLEVIDNGIGMEPELAARAFELFAQAERTPDRSSGGLGLGLALVKSLVELHGGSVHCSSEGAGKGSCFSVGLPLVSAQVAAPAPQLPEAAPQSIQQRLRVMVVDDNADAAHMLAMFLEADGHQVQVEHDARQALERARVDPPDVCLLDLGLPDMDGNELARQLKSHAETAGAVLVAVTGYGGEHDRTEALAAGFSQHLVKPVDPAQLTLLLSRIRPAP